MECWPSFIAAFAPAVSTITAFAALVVSILAYRRSHRPDVIVFLESDQRTGSVYMCVGNFGSGTAHDVSVKMSEIPPVEDEIDAGHLKPFLENGIPTLPPGAVRKTAAGSMDDKAYSDPSKEYIARVKCYRRSGSVRVPIRGRYSLDFHTFWEAVETVVQY